jgi:AcrR family transcriptional regulator
VNVAGKESIRGQGRERLIGAAAACYSKGGGSAMTINRVCTEAKVSVGTAYHHFPGGIPDLEGMLYLDTLASYQRGLLAELRSHRSASAGVKATVLYHLDWMASNLPLAHYVLFFCASWLSDEHLKRLEAMNAEFGMAADEWRKPHVKSGDIRRMPSLYYGSVILGPAQQFGGEIVARYAAREAVDAIRRAGPALAEAAWLAVKGPARGVQGT